MYVLVVLNGLVGAQWWTRSYMLRATMFAI